MPNDTTTLDEWLQAKLTLACVKTALKLAGYTFASEVLALLGWFSFLHGDSSFRRDDAVTQEVDSRVEIRLFSHEREQIRSAARQLPLSDKQEMLELYDEYIARANAQ